MVCFLRSFSLLWVVLYTLIECMHQSRPLKKFTKPPGSFGHNWVVIKTWQIDNNGFVTAPQFFENPIEFIDSESEISVSCVDAAVIEWFSIICSPHFCNQKSDWVSSEGDSDLCFHSIISLVFYTHIIIKAYKMSSIKKTKLKSRCCRLSIVLSNELYSFFSSTVPIDTSFWKSTTSLFWSLTNRAAIFATFVANSALFVKLSDCTNRVMSRLLRIPSEICWRTWSLSSGSPWERLNVNASIQPIRWRAASSSKSNTSFMSNEFRISTYLI